MALDTRNKRASAIGVGLPWRGMYPAPDGSIDQADRQTAATLYAGILAGEVSNVTGPVFWAAGDVYLPGFQQGQSYLPGFQEGQVT